MVGKLVAARFQKDELVDEGPQQRIDKLLSRPQAWAALEQTSRNVSVDDAGGVKSAPPFREGQSRLPLSLIAHWKEL